MCSCRLVEYEVHRLREVAEERADEYAPAKSRHEAVPLDGAHARRAVKLDPPTGSPPATPWCLPPPRRAES
jgi:hypothetical protein